MHFSPRNPAVGSFTQHLLASARLSDTGEKACSFTVAVMDLLLIFS